MSLRFFIIKAVGLLAAYPAASYALQSLLIGRLWLGGFLVLVSWACYSLAVILIGIKYGFLYRDGSPILDENATRAANVDKTT